MHNRFPAWTLCALALAAAGPAMAGAVEVKFVDADRYIDAGNSKWDEGGNLKVLEGWMQSLGTRYLPADQKLEIQVLEVDLAGEKRWRRGNEIRVLRGRADWPRISVRYKLLDAGGQTLRQGEALVSDPAYMQRSTLPSNEPLPHEKRMLEEWFRKSFAQAPAAARP